MGMRVSVSTAVAVIMAVTMVVVCIGAHNVPLL